MIEQARQNAAAQGVDATFAVAGLGELASLGRTFDAVLCLGNSLPHLLSASAVAQSLADFATTLRPGGLLVIQNRNFDRVWASASVLCPRNHSGKARKNGYSSAFTIFIRRRLPST